MGKEKRRGGSVYPGTPFTDVEGSPWGEAICWAYKKGLFQGVAPLRFAPDRPMTRGMLALVAHRAAGCPAPRRRGYFLDVKPESCWAAAADWSAERGLFQGVGGRRFALDRALTWEELAAVLWRWAGQPRLPEQPETVRCTWGAQGFAWAWEQGLFPFSGEGAPAPGSQVTRGQTAWVAQAFWGGKESL